MLAAMKKSVSFFRLRRCSPAAASVEIEDEDRSLSYPTGPVVESLEATRAEEKIFAEYD